MSLFFKTNLVFVFFLSLGSQSCPNSISSLKTNYLKDKDLCYFHDEYRSQLKWGKYKFKNPEKIANLIAPRLINYPDWIKKRNSYLDPAREIYQPAPLTWNQWMVAADKLDAMASNNFNEQKIKLISFDWLLKLHQLSLQGLTQFPGKVRALPEFGLVLNSKEALTKKQIQGVNSFSLDSKSKSMISFHPLKCFENQKESITSKYAEVNGASLPFDPNDWESVEKNNFFTDSEGIEKQCGYITYLDPKLVNEELEKWINYVNETISAINEHRLNEDFFLAVSKIQRWFIVIHPFERGNGRASRFVLDYIFKSLGFPTSTLRDMNFDLYTNESEWANEIMEGLFRTHENYRSCYYNMDLPGCDEVK